MVRARGAFGEALPTPPDLPFTLQRDLPVPASKDSGSRWPWGRCSMAATAPLRRDLVTRTKTAC